MRSAAPQLLATNVNEWFYSKPERRMVRTLDDHVRAFLSDSEAQPLRADRYRRLDNYELAEAVLPVLGEMGEGIQIVSSELTDTRIPNFSQAFENYINDSFEVDRETLKTMCRKCGGKGYDSETATTCPGCKRNGEV